MDHSHIAPMIAGFIFRYLYYSDGLITYLFSLKKIRLPQEGVLGNAFTALLGISFTDILQWTPFFVIILLAGIQSIPDEIEETMGAPGTSSHIGATSLVTMLPPMLIFLVLEKYVVRGLTFGAVKG